MLLTDIAPLVVIHTPMVPSPIIEHHILLAVRELCTQCRVWQTDISLTTTGATTEALTAPLNTEIVDPLPKASYFVSSTATTGRPIELRAMGQVIERDPSWASRTGTPEWFVLPDLNKVILIPKPPTAAVVKFRVCLRPTLTATSFDDRVGSYFNEQIARGALARIFAMRNRPWTDLPSAADYRAQWEQDKASASVTGPDQYGRVPRSVAYGGL